MCKYLEEMQKCPCKFTNSLQMYACISQAETMHVCKFVNISARMNEREYSDGISLVIRYNATGVTGRTCDGTGCKRVRE